MMGGTDDDDLDPAGGVFIVGERDKEEEMDFECVVCIYIYMMCACVSECCVWSEKDGGGTKREITRGAGGRKER
jgi:hypothetical protein